MRVSSVPTVQDADRIVIASGHPAGAALVDPVHLARSGGSPADVAPPVAAHPERHPYFQPFDAPAEAPRGGTIRDLLNEAVNDRLSPGYGEIPLNELIDVLPPGPSVRVEAPLAPFAVRSAAEKARKLITDTRCILEGVQS